MCVLISAEEEPRRGQEVDQILEAIRAWMEDTFGGMRQRLDHI